MSGVAVPWTFSPGRRPEEGGVALSTYLAEEGRQVSLQGKLSHQTLVLAKDKGE